MDNNVDTNNIDIYTIDINIDINSIDTNNIDIDISNPSCISAIEILLLLAGNQRYQC